MTGPQRSKLSRQERCFRLCWWPKCLITIITLSIVISGNVNQTLGQQQISTSSSVLQDDAKVAVTTTKTTSFSINSNDPTGYFTSDSLHSIYDQKFTFDEYLAYSMKSLALVAGFDNDIHRYDNSQDLIDSFARNLTYSDDLTKLRAYIDSSEMDLLNDQNELILIENELNQVKCEHQLDVLLIEAMKLFKSPQSYSSSRQLALIDFFDSYGSAPSSQLMMGNSMWLGSFDQCTRARFKSAKFIDQPKADNELIFGRYCVAKLQAPSWFEHENGGGTKAENDGEPFIKLGICLPDSCNSISIRRHSSKIETLIKLIRLQQVPLSSYRLAKLFCLPDEESPLRQLSLSARIFVLTLLTWFVFVAYFSIKYELFCSRENNDGHLIEKNQSKWIQIFALRLSWNKLFSTNDTNIAIGRQKLSELFKTLEQYSPMLDIPTQAKVSNENTTTSKIHLDKSEEVDKYDIVPKTNNIDLSAIDGIKVISMIWLISAHTMLFFIRVISNGRDFWSILLDARFMTIMAGIFPVDSFFTVTGVLTAYLKFNKNDGKAMSKLAYWLEAFLHRYLRFMPMYLIIFWYTRDVSQYIGSGPLWDYATADTSLRSICKHESALVPILFQANFKPLDQHCVKPAWYLANDYQFLLVTPFFMALMICSKWLGYLVIGASILGSLIMQFLTVFQADDFSDFETLINFKPLFATYVLKNLWRLYVLPYNRIVPYLIGLFTGHLMYCVNKKTNSSSINYNAKIAQQQDIICKDTNGFAHKTNGECPKNHKRQATSQLESPESQLSYINSMHHMIHHDSNESLGSTASASSSEISNGQSSTNDIIPRKGMDSNNNNARGTKSLPLSQVKTTTQISSHTKTNYLAAIYRHVCIKVWIPLIFLISIIYLPTLTKLTTQQGNRAKIGASLLIALMRFIWSLAIARLIYICATKSITKTDSFIIRFLSSPLWKPWSKIGLSVLLIQWEIISYFAQIQSNPPIMTIGFLLAIVLICIFSTYALGSLVYLTIEYPLSQIEHLYIHHILFSKR